MVSCARLAPGPDPRRPAHEVGHADAALEQVHLLAGEGPDVGKPFPAVVAGEHHDRVALRADVLQRCEDAADALVHVVDHAEVGVDRAAREVADVLAVGGEQLGLRLVGTRLPGPVRRGVVEREQERFRLPAPALDVIERARADQVGEIADAVHLGLSLPQVVHAGGVAVREVVQASAHRAEEFLVAALERPEVRRVAQVPLADQRGGVARVAQERRPGSGAPAAGRARGRAPGRCARRRRSARPSRRAAGTGSGRWRARSASASTPASWSSPA